MVTASVNPSQMFQTNVYSKSTSQTKDKDVSEMSFASNLKKTSKETNKQTVDNLEGDNIHTEQKNQNSITDKEVSKDDKIKENANKDDEAIKDYDKAFAKIKEEMKKSKVVSTNVNENTFIPQLQIVDFSNQENIQVNTELKNDIANSLNITVDELDNKLNEMNISVYDLKDEKNLKELISDFMNIEDEFELLTNNELYSEYKQTFDEVISKLEVLELEDANNTAVLNVETVTEQQVNVVDVESDDNTEKNIKMNSNDVDLKDVDFAEVSGVDIKDAINNTSEFENTFSSNSNNEHKDNENIVENKDMSFMNIRNDSIVTNIADAIIEATGDVNQADVVSQIIENVKAQAKPGITSLEMQLYPEHLGKVSIQVTSKDGILSAEISAQTEAAKKAIEGQLTILKDNLNNQGIKVDAVEVTIAGHGFEENLERDNRNQEEASRNSKRVRKDLLDELNGVSLDDELEEVKMETIGNTVSYKA